MSTQHGTRGHPPDDTELAALVRRARAGSHPAWTALFEMFRPLIRAVARGYRLTDCDVDDVGQSVWVQLLENVDRIREPRALPGWLVTTARRESLRVIRYQRRAVPVDPLARSTQVEPVSDFDLDADILRAEEAQVLQEGLAELPPAQRELLVLLTGEELLSYREISTLLTMPVGSIGPTRSRGLARLRATPVVREYLFPVDCDEDCRSAHSA